MTDSDKQKDPDWDQEMREVNRLLAKLPEADPNLVGGHAPTLKKPVPSAAPRAATDAGPTGSEWLGAWARVLLGLLVGAGMTQWPDTHECGFHLLFYGVGIGAVLAAGLWSSWASWKRRLAVAHIISLLLIVWGLVLAAREVLPRIGYASSQREWLCK